MISFCYQETESALRNLNNVKSDLNNWDWQWGGGD